MSRMGPYTLKNLSMHEESKSPGSFPPPRSALDANPYGWREEARSARTAPLWMLYEEEREGVVSSAGGRKQWGRAQRFSPLIHAPVRDAAGRAGALGGRKTSSARVWVKEGDGRFSVNSLPLHKYFPRHIHRTLAMEPLTATQAVGAFDVDVSVRGGGLSGQAGAVRHGLAKALVNWDPNLSPLLKASECFALVSRARARVCVCGVKWHLSSIVTMSPSISYQHSPPTLPPRPPRPFPNPLTAGMLVRDPRMKERKKPGQKGARAKFQWVRR